MFRSTLTERSCTIEHMTQPLRTSDHNAMSKTAHVLDFDDPSELTLEELRELPQMFTLGLDLDACPTTQRNNH